MSVLLPSHRQILAHSVQNRPIEGVFFGPPQPERLNTLIVGVFHGDETISGALVTHFVEQLQAGQFAGEPIDFRARPTLIIPVLNSDGLAAGTRVNANGVDLNRNYPTPDWAEDNRDTPYYSGLAAASEPETRLMIELIERYQPQKILTVHSPYKVLNFDGPARAFAEAMSEESGYAVVESIGYPTPGSFGTYAGVIRQIPVVTLELPPGLDEPFDPELPPAESLEQVWAANRTSLEVAIRF
ncbi:M14 family zinc carboxypeptidase [Vampirovibrio chlorellavorus]|uniref:M14 family zinc carboxypeptidase n=1 Tax=Vampirovibrio chlorellavorus TaxID=758823 RepID=UPI0026F183E9|nr:M14 family zinc carboxypeptidase [Vampirovibrio chlorellavorus]